MILENLKFIAGVLFYGLADLFLAVLWILFVPGVIYGIVKAVTRTRHEDDEDNGE